MPLGPNREALSHPVDQPTCHVLPDQESPAGDQPLPGLATAKSGAVELGSSLEDGFIDGFCKVVGW